MTSSTIASLSLSGLVLLTGGAWAQGHAQDRAQDRVHDHPPILPRTDAAVTYELSGAATQAIPGGITNQVTLRWSAASQRLRIEAAGRPQVALLDLVGHSATILDGTFRTAMRLPFSERSTQRLRLDGARFTRRGQDVVAGVACTLYAVQHQQHGQGTICLTPDGVPLRADGEVDGRQGSFIARQVELSPQPDSLFRMPNGYATLNLGMGRVN